MKCSQLAFGVSCLVATLATLSACGGGSSRSQARATATVLSVTAAPTAATYTGVAGVDAIISDLLHGRIDDLAGKIRLVSRPDIVSGTPTDTFFGGCAGGPYPTTVGDAIALIKSTFGEHAWWSLFAVIETGLPEVSQDGYVIGLRAATGNSGFSLLVTKEGKLIGLDPCRLDMRNATPDPALHYLYGPTY